MPWIDSLRSDFTPAFENFWNGWAARRRDIVFIVYAVLPHHGW